MNEPSIDFWDEYYSEVNERPSIGTILATKIRAACNNMTQEERDEALNRALDIIYINCPEKDPRKL